MNHCRGVARYAPTPAIRVLADGTFKPSDQLTWNDGHFFIVITREGKEAVLQPSFPIEQLMTLLHEFGETPLPPYMKDSSLQEEARRREYQTVFAREQGSVAVGTTVVRALETAAASVPLARPHFETILCHPEGPVPEPFDFAQDKLRDRCRASRRTDTGYLSVTRKG